MLEVFIANRFRFVVSLKIVVAVGQTEAPLIDSGGDLRTLLKILVRTGTESGVEAYGMKMGNLFLQRLLIIHFRDQIELCLNRFEAVGFDLRFVHAGRVVVADFLFIAALAGGCVLDRKSTRLNSSH